MKPDQVWVAGPNISVYINRAVEGYFIRHWLGFHPWIKWYYVRDLDDAPDVVGTWHFEVEGSPLFGPTERQLEFPEDLVAKAPARKQTEDY